MGLHPFGHNLYVHYSRSFLFVCCLSCRLILELHDTLTVQICHHSAQRIPSETSGPLSKEGRRWQTGCHLYSQWCWGQKGVTFHKKTSLLKVPWLALVRECFTHQAEAVKFSAHENCRCGVKRQDLKSLNSRLFDYCAPMTSEIRSRVAMATYCTWSLICPNSMVLSSSCRHFSLFFYPL